jgi:hypothetical protein
MQARGVYQTELRREEWEKELRRRSQERFRVSTNVPDRATQNVLAMHLGRRRAYAAAVHLSSYSLRNYATDWPTDKSRSTGARMFTAPPGR